MRTKRQIALTGIGAISIAYTAGVGATPLSPESDSGQLAKTTEPVNEAGGSTSSAELPIGTSTEQTDDEKTDRDRGYSIRRGNSLHGTTGLLHLAAADSGAPGTFRLSVLTSYYSGSGFLCPTGACGTAPSGAGSQDSASRMGMDLGLSATVLPFLEVSAGTHSHAVSDDYGNAPATLGKSPLIQALGDTYFGAKGFMPHRRDSLFTAGGLGEMRLLNSSGSIGTNSVNVALAALGTLDLSNRTEPERRIPLRFHANLGYLFDNSSSIAKDTEASRKRQISRIERFGLGINRVDSVFMGLGAEYVATKLQPFAEWTLDVAANRQGYTCKNANVSIGDVCMSRATGMKSTPSRLSLGTRVIPGFLGLNAILALDIATSGTSTFVDERAPEIPWDIFLGVGWAIDTVAAPPRVVVKEAPVKLVDNASSRERHVIGMVLDEASKEPIAHASIQFEGRDMTGMVSRANGAFETGNLQPGEYQLQISAEGYKDGSCSIVVPVEPDGIKARDKIRDEVERSDSSEGPNATEVKCNLKAAPAVGSLHGTVISAETGTPVVRASVKARDIREQTVEMQTDTNGAFRAENVRVGTLHVLISAPGYLPSMVDFDIKKKVEQSASFTMQAIPKKPNVKVLTNELRLSSPIRFAADVADLLPESKVLVQEVAAVMGQHPELTRVEIQSYTDEPSGASYSKRLSEERGQSVRSLLVALGVESSRLSVKAFGSEKPLVRGTATEAAREKNRRIVLHIAKD